MRITELPQAASVAQTDDLAIDVPGGKTYRVPRSILAPAPYIATIPTGQWSGSGSDRYITVTASNVTADAMLYPFYDNASAALLNGPVWVIPAEGSFTIHTSAIPSGTVTISVLLAGIVGEAQYQVLADVYSTSQVDSKIAQSTATSLDVVGRKVTGWGTSITKTIKGLQCIALIGAGTRIQIWAPSNEINVWVQTCVNNTTYSFRASSTTGTLSIGSTSASGSDITITRTSGTSNISITVTTVASSTIWLMD